ncbi:MAG: hypothetical protein N0C90_21600 [Candidatus Thiodiazotropha endolucinida]|nr:hypothetical protein [Candidatus Thiodiazotropha taylori]MCW4263951.1 hypothetical protein [Candidatus Thiodiazotropha endolucinida]
MKSLQEHLRKCKKQMPQEVSVQPERPAMCEYCSNMFVKLSDLNRHIKRTHPMHSNVKSGPVVTTATCSYQQASAKDRDDDVNTNVDELGSDPDIELNDDMNDPVTSVEESVSSEPEIHPPIRKQTKPDPVISGKKRKIPLLTFSGKPFDFGECVVTSGIETTSCIKTPIVPIKKSSHNSGSAESVPTSTMTVDNKREFGVQCSMGKGKVEHHLVVETVKTYKEKGADVTRKEVHETRWVE